MTKRLVLAATLAVTLTQAAGAQAPVSPVSSAELEIVVSMLAASAAAVPENLRTPRLTSAVQWLRNNVSKTPAGDVSLEYLRALARATSLLSSAPNPETVEDVTRELEAKVEHCRVLGVGMGGSVRLAVNTRRGSRVVPDWQVLYLLKFDEWLKTPPRNFPRVSSPTEFNVEPGRYWIWAQDPATGTSSMRVLVEVAGQKELRLNLPVP